jgi:hypothetical protein
MTDHELSTRDLAARSDGDEADNSLKTEPPADRTTGATGNEDPGVESSQADGSLTRDPGGQGASGAETDQEPLFPTDESDRFTGRWQEIQASFVDRPRDAVAEADTLVADLMQRLAASFAEERSQLEAQWDKGDDVSTEDLRLALQRYRSFFTRLLQA